MWEIQASSYALMPDGILMWQKHVSTTCRKYCLWKQAFSKEKQAFIYLRNTEIGAFFPEIMGMHFHLFMVTTVWQLMIVFLMVFMLYTLFRDVVSCPRHTLVRVQGWDLWILLATLWKPGPVLPVRWCDHGPCKLPAPSARVFQSGAVCISTCFVVWTEGSSKYVMWGLQNRKVLFLKLVKICFSPKH